MSKRAAIILAGGSAKRFQVMDKPWQDKALADFNNKPLLVYLVERLLPVVNEVFISVNETKRKIEYSKILSKYNFCTKYVIDKKDCIINGPVLAIMSSLQESDADYCLIVPVDMPFLNLKVADYIFSLVEGYDVAVPIWPDGKVETLFMAVQPDICIEITKTLCILEKSRADSILRGAGKLLLFSPLRKIQSLDPNLDSFININRKDDLTNLSTRNIEGKLKQDVTFTREVGISDLHLLREGQKLLNQNKIQAAKAAFLTCLKNFETGKLHFWAGLSAEKLAQTEDQTKIDNHDLLVAVRNYRSEADIYQKKGCSSLAEQALSDAARCESIISNQS